MDLDSLLDSLPRAGRPAVPPKFIRAMSEDDLPALRASKQVPDEARGLSRLRERHHDLARLIAEGWKDVEIGAATGFTAARISDLKRDPSFKELITYYQNQKTVKFMTLHEKLRQVGGAVLDEILERIDERPEEIELKELDALLKSVLDRSGFGPTSKQEVSVSGSAVVSIIQQIKAEASRGGAVRQISDVLDAQFKELPAPESEPCEPSEA